MKKRSNILMYLAFGAMVAGCSEANRNTSPVELVVSGTQDILTVDLADPNQSRTIGTIEIRALAKNTTGTTDLRYLDVKLTKYRVSYRRTDGGTVVPAPFVRTLSGIVPVGGAAQPLNDVLIVAPEAVQQAPFAALFSNNGGVDPETGQRIVKLDVILEVWGETLSGDPVYARDVSPLWVCSGCTL
jgi:hypothetical protein